MPERDRQYTDEQGVLVGMSGGVDSAVAALVLRDQGYRVVGVTLRLWSDPLSVDERACCSAEAVDRAKGVAHSLGIPHLIIDARDAFREQVVRYFVEEYGRGRTPNPCMKCNSRLRFGLLLDIARRLGLGRVATGHYARLLGEPPSLHRGVDTEKDQSYVLAEVAPEVLRHVLFPLGVMRKPEVRARAAEAGLPCHAAPESQEICFVPDDNHRRFLRERLGVRPGAVVDLRGREIGRHTGTYNFTIGQRKGLGIAAEEPLYVVSVAAEREQVVVGSANDLAVGRITISQIVYHRRVAGEARAVQWRSSGGALPAHLADEETIVLERPATGVSPGQTAVVYDGEAVALAGTIQCTEAWRGAEHELPEEGGRIGPVV
jgi:tRNA-uridine 2-sulfurtransferase